MTEELYLLIIAICNIVACGVNTMFAFRNLENARTNAAMARENAASALAHAEIAERLASIAAKQGVVVLQRNR